MKLTKMEVKAHWTREIFRRHRVPIKVVAAAMGLSYPHSRCNAFG